MDRPSWLPETYDVVISDVRGKQVVENHYIELKSTYERTDSGRREMAKDIAALALDGGSLVVGIAEDKNGRALDLSPVELAGFAERLDQAALHRCDPPVSIRIMQLPTPDSPATGVLVVEIPAHPLAPVMVDGRYYGRGERTVRQLSDAEVVRLHQVRASQPDQIADSLTEAVFAAQRDLLSQSGQDGRLVVVVEPAPIRRADLMADVYAQNDWWKWQQQADVIAAKFVEEQDTRSPVLAECLYGGGPFSPLARGLGSSQSRQPHGVMIKLGGPPGGEMRGYLQLDETGAMRFGTSQLIRWERSQRVLDWHFAISSTVYMVGMFAQVCKKAGLRSQFDIGIFLDDLQGVIPQSIPSRDGVAAWTQVVPYSDQQYRRTTRVTVPEMTGDLTGVMERLWGQLLRPMGLGDKLRQRPQD